MFVTSYMITRRKIRFGITRKSYGSTRVPTAFLVPQTSIHVSLTRPKNGNCFSKSCNRIDQQRLILDMAHWMVGVYSPRGSVLFTVDTMAEKRRNEKYKFFILTKKTILIFKAFFVNSSDY